MKVIKDMRVGDEAVVIGYHQLDDSLLLYRKKLLSMGLTPGVKFKLTKLAPLGDPMELSVRGYKMSVRRAEAEVLKIKEPHENCDCG